MEETTSNELERNEKTTTVMDWMDEQRESNFSFFISHFLSTLLYVYDKNITHPAYCPSVIMFQRLNGQ